jgi:hypothetical protein
MREIEKELEQKKMENTLYNPRIALYRQQLADITSQLDGDISDETRAVLLEEQQILNRRISDMIPHDIFSPHQKLWFEEAQKNYELQKPAFRSAEKYQHITDYGTLIPDGPPLDVVRKRSRKQREKLIRKQKTDENRKTRIKIWKSRRKALKDVDIFNKRFPDLKEYSPEHRSVSPLYGYDSPEYRHESPEYRDSYGGRKPRNTRKIKKYRKTRN